MRVAILLTLAALTSFVSSAAIGAEIRVVDDDSRSVVLGEPARRIVSLAPHVTELLYAAGAGGYIVGAVEYSDYPEAAKKIPRVGNDAQLDLERIISLKPDLIVVWLHGSAQRQLVKLITLGIPVFNNGPRRLGDIAQSIERFGRLAGTEAVATRSAHDFEVREMEMRARYATRSPVRVYYQIWHRPLMTINGEHIISDVIRLCGGRNVFADLKLLAPVISTEAVLNADPEVIGVGSVNVKAPDVEAWKKWPRLIAVTRDNYFAVHPDLISRHTPRILEGARQLCEQLEAVRAKRPRVRP